MTEEERQNSGAEAPLTAPTGGVKLESGRWAALSPQWAIVAGQIRTMDAVELGETEPSVMFACGGEHK